MLKTANYIGFVNKENIRKHLVFLSNFIYLNKKIFAVGWLALALL